MPINPERHPWLQRVRMYFIAGIVGLAPGVVTVYILWKLFTTLDGWFHDIYSRVPWLTIDGRPVPGVGVLSVLLLIFVSGVIAKNFIGGQLLRATESQVQRIPLIKGIYGAVRQLSSAFFGSGKALFKTAVIVPFPMPGMYAIGFVSSDAAPEIREKIGGDLVSVYLPTTPNPTSGYLLMVERSQIVELDMDVEDAVKLVISGGAVIPAENVEALTGRAAPASGVA